MRKAVTLPLATAMLATLAPGSPPIRPIEQPWDNSLPAVTEGGDAFLLTRDVKVEVDSPRVGEATGHLFLIFDRSTGFYLREISWISKAGREYPPYMDQFTSFRFSVTSKGIWAFKLIPGACTLYILASAEKAESLDDAESKALTWAAAHIQELEGRKRDPNFAGNTPLILPLEKHLNPANNGKEFIPETLANFAWRDGRWEFTFEGYQRRNRWDRPPGEMRHLKARFTVNSSTPAQSPPLTCVDDKLQETTCP
jgi:hypothetical protein